ncbi:hypothetical protein [Hymenobacter sp. IS2118]|uniref:hypothetical protein n=1 Tax=Hymenobacter sp. IS2118 TaxID=1505605 RepID=UPI0005575543|nr:hypothetical protein [Hymenobacter sp. IS2118]
MKYIASAVFILFFGFLLLTRSGKSKAEFNRISGPVTYFQKHLPGHIDRHDADSAMRYLRISGFPKTFTFFVGKDWGDFKPEFEQLDKIKRDDTLTVYFADELDFQAHKADEINTDAQFVDRSSTPYFIRGSKDRLGAYFFLGVGSVLLITLIILLKRGIIH